MQAPPTSPYKARARRTGMSAVKVNVPKMPKPAKKSAVAPLAKQYAVRARRSLNVKRSA